MARPVCRSVSPRLLKVAAASCVVLYLMATFKGSPSAEVEMGPNENLPSQQESVKAKVLELTKPRGKRSGSWANEFETVKEDTQSVDLNKIQKVMTERNAGRDQVCSDLLGKEKKSYSINPREFVISDKYKLIWCNIFKSASSTWFYNFLTLAGISHKSMKKSRSSPVQFAREKAYPRPSDDYLSRVLGNDSYTSFIILREPFERLLSGYRDKIESTNQMFYNRLRCFMSGSNTNIWGRQCSASFPQFVEYITEQAQNGEALDEHWHPYTSFCAPCLVDYTYILHFESLTAEEYFMFQQVPGLSGKLGLYQLWSSHIDDYETLLRFYFSQLSRQQLDKLIEIYKDDFLLGGYTWEKYYGYVS